MRLGYAKAAVSIYIEYCISSSVIFALDYGVKISRTSKEEVNVLFVEMLLLSHYRATLDRQHPIYLLECLI